MRRTIPHHLYRITLVVMVVVMGRRASIIAIIARLVHRLLHLVSVLMLSVVLVQFLQAGTTQCDRRGNQ